MAKLTDPLYSEEAHGHVGAVVYRTHRGAAIASGKTGPHTGHSGPVSDRLQHLVKGARHWRGMSLRQRYGWKFYAAGHPRSRPGYGAYYISGFALFLSAAVQLAMSGHPPQDDPPSRPLLGWLDYIHATQFGSDIRVDYIYSTLPNPGILSIVLNRAGPFSFGRQARIKDSKRVGHAPVDDHILVETTGVAGAYTLFARLVDSQGLVSPWLRTTIAME